MAKLKVYGGWLLGPGGQWRYIMASTSWNKVAKASGSSVGFLRDYWSITGNDAKVRRAMTHPETLIRTKKL